MFMFLQRRADKNQNNDIAFDVSFCKQVKILQCFLYNLMIKFAFYSSLIIKIPNSNYTQMWKNVYTLKFKY